MTNTCCFGSTNGKSSFLFALKSRYKKTELCIYNKGFKLIIESTAKINTPSYYLLNLIVRCIYIYLFSKQKLSFQTDTWLLNDKCQHTPFYSLIKEASCPLDQKVKINICKYLSLNSYSKLDWRFSFVSNLTLGFNVQDYIGKFRYYWSSFNAYYKSNYKSKIEKESLEKIAKQYFNKKISVLDKTNRDNLIAKLDLSQSNAIIKKRATSIIRGFYIDYEIYDIEEFLLVECGYYYRNKYFHGEKNPPIVSFEKSAELNNIKRICDVLEKYLLLFADFIFDDNSLES